MMSSPTRRAASGIASPRRRSAVLSGSRLEARAPDRYFRQGAGDDGRAAGMYEHQLEALPGRQHQALEAALIHDRTVTPVQLASCRTCCLSPEPALMIPLTPRCMALAASSKGREPASSTNTHSSLGALLAQDFDQGLPEAGKVHGAGQDHLRIQLFQLVEQLDRIAEIHDLEAKGLEVIGQEVFQGVVAGNDQRFIAPSFRAQVDGFVPRDQPDSVAAATHR